MWEVPKGLILWWQVISADWWRQYPYFKVYLDLFESASTMLGLAASQMILF